MLGVVEYTVRCSIEMFFASLKVGVMIIFKERLVTYGKKSYYSYSESCFDRWLPLRVGD